MKKKLIKVSCIVIWVLFFALSAGIAFGGEITLQWTPTNQPGVDHALVFYKLGTQGGEPWDGVGAAEGDSPILMNLAQDENSDPDVVEFTLTGLPATEHTFSVKMRDDQGRESDYSNYATGIPEIPYDVIEIDDLRIKSQEGAAYIDCIGGGKVAIVFE